MATERQVQRTVALCIDIVNRYHDGDRSPLTKATMVAEVQAMAALVSELCPEPGQADERILRPVEAAIFDRYGHELGMRLNGEFLSAFEGLRPLRSDAAATRVGVEQPESLARRAARPTRGSEAESRRASPSPGDAITPATPALGAP